MSNPILLRASRIAARHLLKQRLPLYGNQAVVSFTFDDAPASACTTGAHILETHGVRGTFYVAGSLTGALEQGKPCHTREQLAALLAAGHELGCHSYSHIHCDVLNSVVLSTELSRNATFLESLGVNSRQLNFAYPFGAYALGAKYICSTRFMSSRITGGGPHIGEADLQALKTFRLYEDPNANTGITTFDEALALTAEHKGWLIVNTHDIAETASRYGCTPAHLEEAVKSALAAGCKVMPVADAITYWKKHLPAGT